MTLAVRAAAVGLDPWRVLRSGAESEPETPQQRESAPALPVAVVLAIVGAPLLTALFGAVVGMVGLAALAVGVAFALVRPERTPAPVVVAPHPDGLSHDEFAIAGAIVEQLEANAVAKVEAQANATAYRTLEGILGVLEMLGFIERKR